MNRVLKQPSTVSLYTPLLWPALPYFSFKRVLSPATSLALECIKGQWGENSFPVSREKAGENIFHPYFKGNGLC